MKKLQRVASLLLALVLVLSMVAALFVGGVSAASTTNVYVKNKAGNEVINQALTGKTKGTHTATVNLEGQATDTYTWEIKVTGAAKSKMETFTRIK